VNEEGHVELHDSPIKLVEAEVIGRHPVVGSDVAGDETEIADRSFEFDDCRVGILHRELRGAEEPLGVRGDQRSHRVVGRPCEFDGRSRLDAAEERERIGRQHLPVDADAVHLGEAPLDVHEDAPAVRDRLHRVLADTEELEAVAVESVLGPVAPRGTEGTVEHDVSVQVDDARHGHRPGSATVSATASKRNLPSAYTGPRSSAAYSRFSDLRKPPQLWSTSTIWA